MGDLPPEWAIEEAVKRIGMTDSTSDWSTKRVLQDRHVGWAAMTLLAARYIAAHEEAPIDPLLLEAREIVKAVLHSGTGHTRCNCAAEIDAGKWDGKGKVETALRSLRRGIEIAGGVNG